MSPVATQPDVLHATRLRPAIGSYERMVNAHQRSLVREYDSWSALTRQRLLRANMYGASQHELKLILDNQLELLQARVIDASRRGIVAASRIAVGSHIANTDPLIKGTTRALVGNANIQVRQALIPGLSADLGAKLLAALPLIEREPLYEIFTTMRSRVAAQAGTAWNAVFQVQMTYGLQRERDRKAEGEPIELIRWVLDPLAVHCATDGDRYGCPDLEGIYASWADLPTVPAGRTVCRNNDRCHLEVMINGEWRRGFGDI